MGAVVFQFEYSRQVAGNYDRHTHAVSAVWRSLSGIGLKAVAIIPSNIGLFTQDPASDLPRTFYAKPEMTAKHSRFGAGHRPMLAGNDRKQPPSVDSI